MRYVTAGESHGRVLTTIVTGVPAGVPVDAGAIDADLARRQSGYGRGARQ
jgi:chorismate synthase